MISADSNVFIYTADDSDWMKQKTAGVVVKALSDRGAPIALQVIGEVRNVLQRKFKRTSSEASTFASHLLRAYPSFGYTRRAVEQALASSAGGRTSYWDGLLLASVEEAGCRVLLSEDMRDGATLGLVRIVNPFRTDDGGLSTAAREVLGL